MLLLLTTDPKYSLMKEAKKHPNPEMLPYPSARKSVDLTFLLFLI